MIWDGLVPVRDEDYRAYPPTCTTRITPSRIHYWNDQLDVTARHTFGFRVWASCGEQSQVCGSYDMARAWAREHARTHLQPQPVTIAGPLGDRPAA